ncbi:MAG: GNAT family N-acetyltransferase [Chakrabartia sp.]
MQHSVVPSRKLTIRLARDQREVEAAQRLRWRVFYEEMGAIPPQGLTPGLDADSYDDLCDHLLVIDENLDAESRIVGTYRLLRQDRLPMGGCFYSAQEFDLTDILSSSASQGQLLELGRSCVLPAYRTSATIALLWRGIAEYIAAHDIRLMLGCASFHGTDPAEHALGLSYLAHRHLAQLGARPRAIGPDAISADILPMGSYDERAALMTLPPLVKGYLRTGAMIGEGAFVDHAFNTIDICMVMPVDQITGRYLAKFSAAA